MSHILGSHYPCISEGMWVNLRSRAILEYTTDSESIKPGEQATNMASLEVLVTAMGFTRTCYSATWSPLFRVFGRMEIPWLHLMVG